MEQEGGLMNVKPIKLLPATKDYIWGGTKLKELWGKKADTPTIAECWEFSVYPGSASVVDDAMFKGYTLDKLLEKHPEFFGEKLKNYKKFPVLIKLLDASGDLSVQVHPSDEYALEHEGELGKTEMWYILDADEGAYIYYGFNRGYTREEVASAAANGSITELLNKVFVKKGDCFAVPAGTVHALCRGVTVYEAQENSNVTYRVWDYRRKDKNGRERELHLDKALEVMDTGPAPMEQTANTRVVNGNTVRKLVKTEYFNVKEVRITGEYLMYSPDSFQVVTVADGSAVFDSGAVAEKGDTYFLPAGQMYKLTAENAVILVTSL